MMAISKAFFFADHRCWNVFMENDKRDTLLLNEIEVLGADQLELRFLSIQLNLKKDYGYKDDLYYGNSKSNPEKSARNASCSYFPNHHVAARLVSLPH
jgi:hypothetical protein